MIYLAVKSIEDDNIVALVVSNALPTPTLVFEEMEMQFSIWLDGNGNSYTYCELVEIEESEWNSLLAFGVGKPYRIRAEQETRFVGENNGVERQVRGRWEWSFHEAPDLEL